MNLPVKPLYTGTGTLLERSKDRGLSLAPGTVTHVTAHGSGCMCRAGACNGALVTRPLMKANNFVCPRLGPWRALKSGRSFGQYACRRVREKFPSKERI